MMPKAFIIKFILLIIIILCVLYVDYFCYIRKRQSNGRRIGLIEVFLYIITFFLALGVLDSLGFHGGLRYCYLSKVYHASGWLFALLYPIGALSIPLAAKLIKNPYTKADWQYWAISKIVLFIIFYLLGLYMYWFMYGPLPWHAWPPVR